MRQTSVLLLGSLLIFAAGCAKKSASTSPATPPSAQSAAGNPNCLEQPPTLDRGCPKWVGNTCWVNVEWMQGLPPDHHDPIQLKTAKGNDLTYCTNKTDDGHKFVIADFKQVDCSNPQQPPPISNGIYPFTINPNAPPAHQQSTGPINPKLAAKQDVCYESSVTRSNQTSADPHIIINPGGLKH